MMEELSCINCVRVFILNWLVTVLFSTTIPMQGYLILPQFYPRCYKLAFPDLLSPYSFRSLAHVPQCRSLSLMGGRDQFIIKHKELPDHWVTP